MELGETRCEMASEAGAARVEDGVSGGLVDPLIVEREKYCIQG